MKRLILICFLVAATGARGESPAQCPPAEGVALQVLGSGGPIADDARASTAYVVWIDGASRALIDMGSCRFVRFGAAGADLSEPAARAHRDGVEHHEGPDGRLVDARRC